MLCDLDFVKTGTRIHSEIEGGPVHTELRDLTVARSKTRSLQQWGQCSWATAPCTRESDSDE
eukprot:14400720-Alexandrium_andersonii.AAC.1